MNNSNDKILQELYDSEINFSLSCFWDGGFYARLGDEANGFSAETNCKTATEAIEWLAHQASLHFPQSSFCASQLEHNQRDYESKAKETG